MPRPTARRRLHAALLLELPVGQQLVDEHCVHAEVAGIDEPVFCRQDTMSMCICLPPRDDIGAAVVRDRLGQLQRTPGANVVGHRRRALVRAVVRAQQGVALRHGREDGELAASGRGRAGELRLRIGAQGQPQDVVLVKARHEEAVDARDLGRRHPRGHAADVHAQLRARLEGAVGAHLDGVDDALLGGRRLSRPARAVVPVALGGANEDDGRLHAGSNPHCTAHGGIACQQGRDQEARQEAALLQPAHHRHVWVAPSAT
mmetsp:Transcript_99007/g.265919  ORF Transcript_99007/g.265919 Transcript_99007/m.265919 type:complete len:260 (+) Transcript_99007:1000-1779(+)